MAKLTIFRGLPGSGKSTRARELAGITGALLIEPDMFIIRDGKYCYYPTTWKTVTRKCINMICRCAAEFGCDIIYADVLPTKLAVENVIHAVNIQDDYDLEVIDCKISYAESIVRNTHNVKLEDIERFDILWEDWNNG